MRRLGVRRSAPNRLIFDLYYIRKIDNLYIFVIYGYKIFSQIDGLHDILSILHEV